MGRYPNITAEKFPKQGSYLNQPCRVIFHYGGPELLGKVVRDDAEEPGRLIIQLNDGRFVLATECQWQPLSLAVAKGTA